MDEDKLTARRLVQFYAAALVHFLAAVDITAAQLSMLLEGVDWRTPLRTWRPLVAG